MLLNIVSSIPHSLHVELGTSSYKIHPLHRPGLSIAEEIRKRSQSRGQGKENGKNLYPSSPNCTRQCSIYSDGQISEANSNISLAKLINKSQDTQWAFFPLFLENKEKE